MTQLVPDSVLDCYRVLYREDVVEQFPYSELGSAFLICACDRIFAVTAAHVLADRETSGAFVLAAPRSPDSRETLQVIAEFAPRAEVAVSPTPQSFDLTLLELAGSTDSSAAGAFALTPDSVWDPLGNQLKQLIVVGTPGCERFIDYDASTLKARLCVLGAGIPKPTDSTQNPNLWTSRFTEPVLAWKSIRGLSGAPVFENSARVALAGVLIQGGEPSAPFTFVDARWLLVLLRQVLRQE